jgi:hypothetical protein
MNEMLAFCGLVCGLCPIRLATLEPDEGIKRMMCESIALKLKEVYKSNFSAEQVTDCDGCKAAGRLFNGCGNCSIRLCAMGRKLESCAYCAEYCCEKLERHYKVDPDSRMRTEKLRIENTRMT